MKNRTVVLILAQIVLLAALPSRAQAPEEGMLGGTADAPIKIEVFSDFQCPSCRELYMETIRQVLKEYCSLGKVCVVYRDFPLQMHQYAREAARYALAARKVGRKQWLPVVDALYANQAQWSQNGGVEAVVARAVSPEDFAKVKKLLEDPTINETIDWEVANGQVRNVRSTPTIFITHKGREQRVEGGIPYPILKDFFDRAVK